MACTTLRLAWREGDAINTSRLQQQREHPLTSCEMLPWPCCHALQRTENTLRTLLQAVGICRCELTVRPPAVYSLSHSSVFVFTAIFASKKAKETKKRISFSAAKKCPKINHVVFLVPKKKTKFGRPLPPKSAFIFTMSSGTHFLASCSSISSRSD